MNGRSVGGKGPGVIRSMGGIGGGAGQGSGVAGGQGSRVGKGGKGIKVGWGLGQEPDIIIMSSKAISLCIPDPLAAMN